RLDQEKGPSTPFQRPPYHSALIPGTRKMDISRGLLQSRQESHSTARLAAARRRSLPYFAAKPAFT
ncbi:hypothetical protein, partial [Bradyrhizobium diazoefficiens]